MSDITAARADIISAITAIKEDRGSYAVAQLERALGNMTRKYNKRAKRVRNRVTEAHKRQIRQMCDTGIVDDMTTTEIAQQVIGHASAGGRVSEIIAAYREEQYAHRAA